jgi:hypothetical protein
MTRSGGRVWRACGEEVNGLHDAVVTSELRAGNLRLSSSMLSQTDIVYVRTPTASVN